MKTFITLAGFCLLCVTQVRAQWTVYDPAVHTQTILNGVQEIAKFVEVINNQVQQISALTEQVNEFKKYEGLFGDPSKPGMYVMRLKWLPGGMSRPHFHPHDRFFTVISGTWWVGTGEKFDPESTLPVPAGSYVIHYANKIHYDGAKGEECVIQVSGIGPATSTPIESVLKYCVR